MIDTIYVQRAQYRNVYRNLGNEIELYIRLICDWSRKYRRMKWNSYQKPTPYHTIEFPCCQFILASIPFIRTSHIHTDDIRQFDTLLKTIQNEPHIYSYRNDDDFVKCSQLAYSVPSLWNRATASHIDFGCFPILWSAEKVNPNTKRAKPKRWAENVVTHRRMSLKRIFR